jgi:hypothetical protein
MALTLLKMQQHKHHTVFRSVTSRALPREPCRAAAARALSWVAKAFSEMPATQHVPPADHIAVPLPPSPLPSSSLSLSLSARTRRGARRPGQGQGGRGGRRTPSPTPYATTSTPSSAKSRHAPVSPLRTLTPCGRRSCRACCCC